METADGDQAEGAETDRDRRLCVRVCSCAGALCGLCAAVLFVPSGWCAGTDDDDGWARHGRITVTPWAPASPLKSQDKAAGSGWTYTLQNWASPANLTTRKTWGCLQRFQNSEANPLRHLRCVRVPFFPARESGLWTSLCRFDCGWLAGWCYPLTTGIVL